MYFDFKTFFRAAYLSFFKWKEIPAPFNLKRIVFLLALFTFFPVAQLFNKFCFLLDNILFPDWRKIKLETPVFIVGNPRSGTTFIQRVMAKDEEQFFCFRTWEIIFPAIVQKKFLAFVGQIDNWAGNMFTRGIMRIESRLFRNFNKMHQLGLFYPEEDDKLTAHIFSSLDLLWFIPFPELTYRFSRFDQLVDPKSRKRIMTFYKNCIKRQAYFKGNKGRLLSKNPVCPPKIRSLHDYFPGCKFIWPARNPFEVVPSMINMAHEMWRSAIDIEEGYPYQDMVYDTLKFFYSYPLEQFETMSPDSYIVVNYDDLVHHPKDVVHSIYNHFEFNMSPKTLSLLEAQEQQAKNYRSQHVYSLDQFRITREDILADFKNIFDRFEYETAEINPGANDVPSAAVNEAGSS